MRYGLQWLYLHNSHDTFYFAAEAKAILAVRPELRIADARSLGEFVSCGCVLENRTIFKDIEVLPPASAWTFNDASLQKRKTYFQTKEWENQPALDAQDYYQQL